MAGERSTRGGATASAEVRVEQLDAVFGTRGDAATCWCQFFRLTPAEFRQASADELRERTAHDLADADAGRASSPGVVATLDGEAVGWCAVAPWAAYPRLATSPTALAGRDPAEPAGDGTWSVTCFVVRKGYRRRGIGTTLLRAAVEHAAVHGAQAVEAYPVDTDERRVSAADLYHGPLSLFVAEGFGVVARPRPGRALVRRVLG